MDDSQDDINDELVLDGNAVAGMLEAVFGVEMTASPSECAHCGHVAEIGSMLAFAQGMGAVLRCSACQNVILRVVERPDAIYLDARGAVYLRLKRDS